MPTCACLFSILDFKSVARLAERVRVFIVLLTHQLTLVAIVACEEGQIRPVEVPVHAAKPAERAAFHTPARDFDLE